MDDINFVIFALVNVIWSTVYIELWKRREAEHAFRWGTLDKQDDLITEPRPLYTVRKYCYIEIVIIGNRLLAGSCFVSVS